jgi:hypothetical protein
MRALVRTAIAAGLFLLSFVPTLAPDKSFKRDDLTDTAIKLEAQIKAEAGQVTKSAAALRRALYSRSRRSQYYRRSESTCVRAPVGSGLVATLLQPGGNATGFTSIEYGMSA